MKVWEEIIFAHLIESLGELIAVLAIFAVLWVICRIGAWIAGRKNRRTEIKATDCRAKAAGGKEGVEPK